MKNLNLPVHAFKRVHDTLPVQGGIWKTSGKRWQDLIMLSCNEEGLKMRGGSFEENIGLRMGKILVGLENTDFPAIFDLALATGQAQHYLLHFGNKDVAESDWRGTWVPLPQGHCFGIVADIGAEVRAKKAKAEKIKTLEELNQKLVERELSMIQLKSEIAELEQKVEAGHN